MILQVPQILGLDGLTTMICGTFPKPNGLGRESNELMYFVSGPKKGGPCAKIQQKVLGVICPGRF